jgi:hypothetical protein
MGLGFGIRDPGSGKNLFRIPDPVPGVKKAPDPGSGSATLLTCIVFLLFFYPVFRSAGDSRGHTGDCGQVHQVRVQPRGHDRGALQASLVEPEP